MVHRGKCYAFIALDAYRVVKIGVTRHGYRVGTPVTAGLRSLKPASLGSMPACGLRVSIGQDGRRV